jgi:hypothetical protein
MQWVPSRRTIAIASKLERALGTKAAFKICNAANDMIRISSVRSIKEEKTLLSRVCATVRAETIRAAILGQAVNADAVEKILSLNRQKVRKLAIAGELLAIKDGRSWRFPHWQFDGTSVDSLVPGLQHILRAIDAPPLRKAAWLILPNPHFANRAPIQALRCLEFDRVYQEAKAVSGNYARG